MTITNITSFVNVFMKNAVFYTTIVYMQEGANSIARD